MGAGAGAAPHVPVVPDGGRLFCYSDGPNWRPSTARFHDSWVGMDMRRD